MGFYATKPAFRAALRPVARRLGVIPPDGWTWIAVGLCAVAGGLLAVSRHHPGVKPGPYRRKRSPLSGPFCETAEAGRLAAGTVGPDRPPF